MELLDSVHFLRLRSCGRDEMYLAADGDRTSVRLVTDRRAAANIVWEVWTTKNVHGEAAVLLRGAHGLYLAASERPATDMEHDAVAAVQRSADDALTSMPRPELLWQAVRREEEGLLIRDGVHRFLRANGRYLPWRTAVTVALDNGSSMFLWDLKVVHAMPKINFSPRTSQTTELHASLRGIRSKRDEEFGKKQNILLSMKATTKKKRALMSEAKRIRKRETAEALPFAIQRTLTNIEIVDKAHWCHNQQRIECQTRICELNIEAADIKKAIKKTVERSDSRVVW